MARALWSGALSFGLVNVPVAMLPAVRDLDLHFRQLHEKDGAPIETHRVCVKEGKEVPWEEIAHGYEVSDGKWVLLTDDELAAAQPRKTKTIDIEQFVALEEIDPMLFDHPYLLAPTGGEGSTRAYRLLEAVLEDTDQVALGRVVLRTREYLVAVRPRDSLLTLTTMLFADELRPAKDVAATIKGKKPDPKQVRNAVALIEELGVSFSPDSYRDEHRERLKKIVARKRKGKEIEVPDEPDTTPTGAPDLMAALERSLAEVRG